MIPRGGVPLQGVNNHNNTKSLTLQDRVAGFYYSHGLFCSTYPTLVLLFSISVTFFCCVPLINLPFPGNSPLKTWTNNINFTKNLQLQQQPFCYIQQVVLRTFVSPWESELNLGDAFRAPLYESFKLLEIVRNYQDSHSFSLKTLGHVCLHVEAIKRQNSVYHNVLPQYSCLVLSPANLWQQDVQQFSQDSSLLTTIFNHHTFQKGKTSVSEMLFGMRLFDTGIKRYPLRRRQRVIQYAVTLFFKEYDESFVDGLREKLYTLYPLHHNLNHSDNINVLSNDTLIIQYPGEINLIEFVPLTIAFFLLFIYYYFSIRKIDLIQSKLGMAFTSVCTVLGSLTMTLGLCFFFGLTLNLEGKTVFPYLVLLVGLENVLVLTKSVATTSLHLDVKIRLAQALSKEGWSITKNLFLEITILTFGLFTFVPVIQEFCIFSIVGLITAYFMQMLFFSTMLGIDIRRRENSIEKSNQNFRNSFYQNHVFYDRTTMKRSKSHPRLTNFPTNIVAGQTQNGQDKKIPKRLRLVNLWTRTRFFNRSFMILMVIWIGSIAYHSGFIEHYIINNSWLNKKSNDSIQSTTNNNYTTIKFLPILNTNNTSMKVNYVTHNPIDIKYRQNHIDDLEKLKHPDFSPNLKLLPNHWDAIVQKYNLTLSGQYIVILPNIKVSHVIRPEQAILLRNPDEKYGEKFQWQALAAALDPMDYGLEPGSLDTGIPQSEQPFYPTSVFAMILTTILCLISVIVLGYCFVVFYRCMCSRNYAEWRSSWFCNNNNNNNHEKTDDSSEEQVLLEAVPVVLDGHQQDIECVATDGTSLVSSCLDGQLKVWDTSTGELVASIDRKLQFGGGISDCLTDFNMDNYDDSSDYESGSPPTRNENVLFPRLKRRINTNFSNIKDSYLQSNSYDSKVDFTKSYREFYLTNNVKLRNRYNNNKTITKRAKDNTRKEQKFNLINNNDDDDDDDDKIKNGNSSSCSSSSSSTNFNNNKMSQIWCIDYMDNLIAIGCADGRLEFWEGTTGRLKCIFEDGTDIGISNVKLIGSRLIASRLYGTIDLFRIQFYSHGHPVDWSFSSAYRRTHVRTGSFGSISSNDTTKQIDDDDLVCCKIITIKAHQQPITCLDCEGGRILTGSQDHTLKVFALSDGNPFYTLHGHCGPVTCLFIDRVCPNTSGSGSQDGMLCVWDLLTGACMYSVQAHDGAVTSLTYSASYVISLGTDDRLCVWERFQGHLLNTIFVTQTFTSQVLMLAPHLVVTARNGGLVIWDVRTGDCVRTITLGRSPFIFIKQLILLRDAVLCDYGNQLRIVRFPLITHKFD